MCTDGEAERDGERWREMERDGRERKCASFASSATGHKADNGLLSWPMLDSSSESKSAEHSHFHGDGSQPPTTLAAEISHRRCFSPRRRVLRTVLLTVSASGVLAGFAPESVLSVL